MKGATAVKKKLRSRRGVTLTEMLVTVIIIGLMTAGVATGISASLNVYHESTQLSDAQTLSATLAQAVMDELRYATNVSGDAPTYDSMNYGEDAVIAPNADGRLAVNGIELIGSGAYNGLKANITYPYSGGAFSVTIMVSDANGELITSTPEFSVTPLS